MVEILFCLSLTLLRYSNLLRPFDTHGHWSRTLSDLDSGLNGWMGLALIFTRVHFSQDRHSRLPTWLLQTQDSRGEAGTFSMNRQDGQEVAVAFTGEQNFASSVLASSSLWCPRCPDTFPKSCLWTRFSIGSLDHSTWVLGSFPLPFPHTKSSQKTKPWFPQV